MDVIEILKFLGKFTKKYIFYLFFLFIFFLGGGSGGGGVGSVWCGVQVDVYKELKFLWKFKKKMFGGGSVGGGVRVGRSEWM